ncbi:MAG: tannase/feruloyl esterase family alpha/beta hydrolase [Acidobacteria bacterium]|nr:tannase/feruloyl esterase family alpha/beta hydrolase [Acidobacteriota bacterium]
MRKLLWLAGGLALSAGDNCAALLSKKFKLREPNSAVTIHSAAMTPAQGNLPAHCDVRGVIWPEAKFAIKLPAEWNERFQMVGNGGTAGNISMGAVDGAVRKGFASASTDTGHDVAKEPVATFAWVTPENPHGKRKLIDFAYLSVHNTAALAKQVVKAYYGKPARYSYWVGCSTGGRQGMQEAQRYPEDFDGYVIGAPGLYLTGNVTRRMWVAQSQMGEAGIQPDQLPALAEAVMAKCDAIDGVKDGLIDDPRKCQFDPKRDLPRCGTAPCFTEKQLDGLSKIYGGVRNSKGELLFPGEPFSGEPVWAENLIGPSKVVLPRSESQMKLAMLDPPPGPSWSYTMFNFDTDPPRVAKAAAMLNPRNPDLSKVKKRGGKIVQYSGWGDQQVNPFPGIEYYEAVAGRMGQNATRDFYRLFMVPGMYHCSGGPGCGSVDWLAAVMDWVEKGIAPEQLIGAHVEGGKTTRTRPLCPYPQVAKYKGSGSIDDAANFACAAT